jgi:peptidoglycan/LPS O-acetylase OafA/YrhL
VVMLGSGAAGANIQDRPTGEKWQHRIGLDGKGIGLGGTGSRGLLASGYASTMDNGKRMTYEFADGLRALAAVTVAIYHAYLFTGLSGSAERELPGFFGVLKLGDFAVPIFIVLSGFLLMPAATTARELKVRGGVRRYVAARARRILPPYYASLVLFLGLILLVPVLNQPSGTAWDSKIPVTPGGVASHLLLFQNISPEWIYQINGPAWSVATEWQLYFALPFLLLPLWKRIGAFATVAVALALGVGVSILIPSVFAAHFWFLGLFAMGMAAAYFARNGDYLRHAGKITAGYWALVVIAFAVGFDQVHRYPWLSESAVGLGVAMLLLWLATTQLAGRQSRLRDLLQARPLRSVAGWSYSLYLIHSPILALGNLLLLPLPMDTWLRFTIQIGVVLPVAMALSYLFYLLVERRFQRSRQKRTLPAGSSPMSAGVSAT